MSFTSAILGTVQHPTNILTEYLSRFREGQKIQSLHPFVVRRLDSQQIKGWKAPLGLCD